MTPEFWDGFRVGAAAVLFAFAFVYALPSAHGRRRAPLERHGRVVTRQVYTITRRPPDPPPMRRPVP